MSSSSSGEKNDYEDDFEDAEDENKVHERLEDQSKVKTSWKHINFKKNIELGKRIGGGGVGIVYDGHYNGKKVALKTLFDPRVDESLKQEYMDELLVMSKLQHPNIVKFYGACMDPPDLCFVMELCECSLYQLLHETQAEISTHRLVEMAVDVASAMEYLHSLSPVIIHRDLKSHNLLLNGEGIIKLCDFGLVRTKITTAGTPCYMPPELLQGKPFSKSVDVYMFGILLCEMFSRSVPFYGYNIYDIKEMVVNGKRPEIPKIDCPYTCQDLMKKCWDQEARNRPNFKEIHQVLVELLEELPTQNQLDSVDGGDALDDLLK